MLRSNLPEIAGPVALLRNECALQQAAACIMPSLADGISHAASCASPHVFLNMRRWRHMWRTLSPRAPRSPSEERSLTCQSPTTRCVALSQGCSQAFAVARMSLMKGCLDLFWGGAPRSPGIYLAYFMHPCNFCRGALGALYKVLYLLACSLSHTLTHCCVIARDPSMRPQSSQEPQQT